MMEKQKALSFALLISIIMGSAALPSYAETSSENLYTSQNISNEHTDTPEQLKQQLEQLDQEITKI